MKIIYLFFPQAAEISIRRNWVEVRRSDVTLQDKLGEGAFGEVFKGVVRLKGKSRACAIKKLKGKDFNSVLILTGHGSTG